MTSAECLFEEAHNNDTRGFVLLSVVLVIGVVSALVVSLTMEVRSSRANASTERRLVQATALADAGLVRAIAALETSDDRLWARLLNRSEPARWRFTGGDVLISLVPETGKVDLNSGDPDLVVNLLRAVVEDGAVAERLVRRLDALRRTRQDLETVRGLLDPDYRASPLARDLEAVFTVWTNLRGVDPRFAPPIVLRQLPGLQEGEAELLVQARDRGVYAELSPFIARFGPLLGAKRPIYRAQAEATIEGVTVRREALLIHNPGTRTTWIVFWRDVID
ncbi:hypothetical protein [Microvirga flavescens]|uniref:hypothetical protein n=1 Tax=Microvirga flavescens TaxID=2249811 RepID=UPI001300B9B3|nr:hypothetical protein [Microvirga flavescens]